MHSAVEVIVVIPLLYPDLSPLLCEYHSNCCIVSTNMTSLHFSLTTGWHVADHIMFSRLSLNECLKLITNLFQIRYSMTQEAQLSPRGCAMLHVMEDFAKPL